MKLRKDDYILRFSGIAAILILINILMMSFSPAYFEIGFALGIMGAITIITTIAAAARPKVDPILDERSVRVNEKAGHHAFCVLLATMALLQLVGMIRRLNFDFKDIVPGLFIIGIWSWIMLRWYYNLRGDVR
nr:hypothetical protein ANHBFCNH_00002 [Methanosarcinales archaeon ANME-2c ERB4]